MEIVPENIVERQVVKFYERVNGNIRIPKEEEYKDEEEGGGE